MRISLPGRPRSWGASTLGVLVPLLTLLAGCGGSDTPTDPGVAPTANFTSSPNGGNPLVIQFTDASTAGSAAITAWSWTFGDGGTSTSQSPSHTYAAAGTYTVGLTVTTSVGNNATTKSVTVTGPVVQPTANFAASVRSGEPALSVQFTDTSIPGSSAISSWSWDFGDGGSSTLQSPQHTYAALGFYDVTLTVTTNAGSDDKTVADYIEVYQAIIVSAPTPNDSLPPIPTITAYGQTFPQVERRLLSEGYMRSFVPVVDSLYLRYWEGTNDVDDCVGLSSNPVRENGTNGTITLAPSWFWAKTRIPQRNTTNFTSILQYTGHDVWPGSLPKRISLYFLSNTYSNAFLGNLGYGRHGGGPGGRWLSCEERGNFTNEFTSYGISYHQPIQQLPRMRHYVEWQRFVYQDLGTANSYRETHNKEYGVSNTTAFEITATITASVTAEQPGMRATLETSLSTTLSESRTFSSSSSVSQEYNNAAHRTNYANHFSLWRLVDVYQIEGNTPGRVWSDPTIAVNPANLRWEIPRAGPYQIITVWVRQPGT